MRLNYFLMYKPLFLIISLVFCTCCSNSDKEIVSVLDLAESLLEHRPDSSLFTLNSVNLKDISSKSCKARYALLKSIALDKNYIDVSDDSLTSIAVAYYGKHGDADERLKAYLYNGRVHKNAKDYEQAMNDYLHAEESVKDSDNNVVIGRLYTAKSVLYNIIFDAQSAIEQSRLASKFFLQGGDTSRFLNSVNNLAIIMNNNSLFDSLSVSYYTKQIEEFWGKLTPSQKCTYYFIQLERIPKTDTASINLMLNKIYDLNLKDDKVSWLSVADAYYNIGNIDEALKSVMKYKLDGSIADVTYYSILSKLYSKNGEYERAYNYLVKRNKLLQGRYYKAVNTDTKFLEERYASNMRDINQKYLIIFLMMGIIIIVLALFLLRKHYKSVSLKHQLKILTMEEESKLYQEELKRLEIESENYELKCREAIKEQEKLRSIIESNDPSRKLNSKIVSLVKQRLLILDKFIAANISSAFSKQALNELNQLMRDKDHFLESTRLSYSLSYPNFIEYLYSKGLTDREVAFCCLYCIGLNGSEISNYLEMKSFYNMSKGIRRKLAVDRSMNIDTYLHKLLVEVEQ